MSLDIFLRSPAEDKVLFSANITHNLGTMAKEADLYKYLWRPEENGVEYARQLLSPLAMAIFSMEDDPQRFKDFNAKNGWGTYDDFLPWLRKLLDACLEYPTALIWVSR